MEKNVKKLAILAREFASVCVCVVGMCVCVRVLGGGRSVVCVHVAKFWTRGIQ